jgi:hypothetical protein
MSQTCPWTATLADKLFAFDTAIAEAVRAGGCPHCGARLHRASYPRKPRGVPAEHEEQFAVRLSLCCGRDGCRKRATPPSVRFLGPKVYVGIIVVIGSALMQLVVAAKDKLVASAPRRTVRRWLDEFWPSLPSTAAYQQVAGYLPVPVARSSAPLSWLGETLDVERARQVLQLLCPLTTASFSAPMPMVAAVTQKMDSRQSSSTR